MEQETGHPSFTFKNLYVRPKSYPFVDGASTAARCSSVEHKSGLHFMYFRLNEQGS